MGMYPRVGGRLLRPTTGMISAAARVMAWHGRIGELLPLERVLVALDHREPDRVPMIPFLLGAARRLTGVSYADFAHKPELAAEAYMAMARMLGSDAVYNVIDLSVEAADFGQEMVYPAHTTAHPDYARPRIATPDDYERLESFDPRKSYRMSRCIELARILAKQTKIRYATLGFIFGPLGVLSMMRGARSLFMDCALNPEKVKAGLEVVTEVLMDYARAQCDAGVDGIMLDTLFGSQSGVSRDMWVEMEGVYVRRITDEIRRCGALVALHNCGTGPYFDLSMQYMEPVVISFAYLPDDCRDNRELKEKYGKVTALAGYVPTEALCMEPPAGIVELARRQIRDLAPGGGYVLAPGCEYPPNLDLAGVVALAYAAKRYGRYPIRDR